MIFYPKVRFSTIRTAIILKESVTLIINFDLELTFFCFRCVEITASRLTFMAICTITNHWKLQLSQRWMRTGNYDFLPFSENLNYLSLFHFRREGTKADWNEDLLNSCSWHCFMNSRNFLFANIKKKFPTVFSTIYEIMLWTVHFKKNLF